MFNCPSFSPPLCIFRNSGSVDWYVVISNALQIPLSPLGYFIKATKIPDYADT